MGIRVMYGHGGTDPGAIGLIKEADKTHEIGREIVNQGILLGAKDIIGISSTGNLKTGIANINAISKNTDVMVAVHINAGPPTANGFESLYADPYYNGKTKQVVDGVHSAMARVCGKHGMRNRGIKSDITTRYKRLGALRDTDPYAVLIEVGFVGNTNDVKLLNDKAFIVELSKEIAMELMRLDGQKIINPNTPSSKPEEPIKLSQNLPLATLEQGTYLIASKLNGKVLTEDIKDKVTNTQLNGGNHQRWLWNGSNFINKKSGKYLDVYLNDQEQERPVVTHDANSGDNQSFMIATSGEIIAKHSNMVLDIKLMDTKDHAEIMQFKPNGGFNQQWNFIKLA